MPTFLSLSQVVVKLFACVTVVKAQKTFRHDKSSIHNHHQEGFCRVRSLYKRNVGSSCFYSCRNLDIHFNIKFMAKTRKERDFR